jgi:ATP-dependent DNA helicase RecG
MMNMAETIKSGESETTEFKTSLAEWRDVVETISAFSNKNGGTIFIGVGDTCEIVGTDTGKNTIEVLANQIKQNVDPVVYPSIRVENMGKKQVIVVDVAEHEQKPVFAFGRAVIRVGKSNQKLGYEGIRNLAINTSKVYWDGRACVDADLEDIDEEKVKWFLNTRFTRRKVAIPSQMRFEEMVMNIGCAKRINKEVQPTNAGVIFFCKYSQRFIPLRILCARFKGVDLSRTTLDSLDCSGTLVEMLEQTEEFIRRNMRLFGFRTAFSFRRIDKLEYPIEALREAVLNALVHRDCEAPSDIRVFIFDDRIEITNPGSFPCGTTPENPLHIPRNPMLCQLMRDVGYIEKYGTGIYFMKDVCEEWGIPEPEFIVSDIETKVIFRSGGKAVVISEIENLGVELNDRQRNALKYAFMKGFINNQIYREINGVSDETSRQELSQLVEKGLLKIKGKGRSTKYVPTVGD